MNLLAFTYIPIPIRIGSGCDVSNLPTYAGDLLIAGFVVGFVALICLCLCMAFDAFGNEDVSDAIFKCTPILLTLSVLLVGIALLCALIGV